VFRKYEKITKITVYLLRCRDVLKLPYIYCENFSSFLQNVLTDLDSSASEFQTLGVVVL
jgi:hypothetical protein